MSDDPVKGDAFFNVECATPSGDLPKEVRFDLRESFVEFHREVSARQARWLEAYLCAWVAETGIKPSEAELVMEPKSDAIVFRVRRRGEP